MKDMLACSQWYLDYIYGEVIWGNLCSSLCHLKPSWLFIEIFKSQIDIPIVPDLGLMNESTKLKPDGIIELV